MKKRLAVAVLAAAAAVAVHAPAAMAALQQSGRPGF
jgi:opacity protein-like surface antigen